MPERGMGLGGADKYQPVQPQAPVNNPQYDPHAGFGAIPKDANLINQMHGEYIDPNSGSFNNYEMRGDPTFARRKADELKSGVGRAENNYTRDFSQADSYRNAAMNAGDQLRGVYQGNGPTASTAMMQAGLMQSGVGGPATNARAGYANAQRNAMGANSTALGNSMNEMNAARGAYNQVGLGMSGQDLQRQNNGLVNDQARNGIMDQNTQFRYGLADSYEAQQQAARGGRAQARNNILGAVVQDNLGAAAMDADSKASARKTAMGVASAVAGGLGKIFGR